MNSTSLASTLSDSSESEKPLLASIRLLNLHFQHGGVSKRGYEILYRMIQMMSAIGYDAHVMFMSKIAWAGSIARMEWYANCILQGCDVFRNNMTKAVRKSMQANRTLPKLEGELQEGTRLKEWSKAMANLHKPTRQERRLFELMLNHYDDIAFQRLIHLNALKPQYRLQSLVESANSVHDALEELHHLAHKANDLVLALDLKFNAALHRLQAKSPAQKRDMAASKGPELLPATTYQPLAKENSTRLHAFLSKSFGVAEDEIVYRGHTRAATFADTRYAATAETTDLMQRTIGQPTQSTTLGARRKGNNIPRIFTGSFSQLESDLRKLQLDKVETPVTHSIDRSEPRVRDFGATPAISPCRTQSPQPLQRREALVSRDIEFQDRVINGELVKSRRPSTKTRAQTIDDSSGGLKAWLSEPPRQHTAEMYDSSAHRSMHRHREHTI